MGMPPPPPERLFAVMHDGSRPVTWGEVAVRSSRACHSLGKRLPDSIIAGAIYGKNCPEWLLCARICGALGLRTAAINWHLVADEIAYIVDDCDADVVFFGREYAKEVAAMKSRTPTVKLWVCMDGTCNDALSLEGLIAEAAVDATPPEHRRLGGTISYTGGTSGRPKGALRSGGKPADPARAMKMLEEWGMLKMMPNPVMLVSAPLYHAMPNAWAMIGMGLGTTFIMMPKFEAVAALAAIDKFKVNGFYMPPILLKRLIQAPEDAKSKYDRSSVKCVMSSGAACPTVVKHGIHDMFGAVLYELYGASELGGVAIMDPSNMLKKPLSCGKPAYGMDVILLDDDRNKIDKPGAVGEIFAKGFNVDGYHKLDAKTRDSMFGDYMTVGDVGYFDEDGYLFITTRKIDMIISGGANIYPAQVEEVMQAHPDIEDVAVFGLPDEEYGEKVHAAVKLLAGRAASAEDILRWCDGKIGKFQLPKAHNFSFHSEDFPRSEAGKLRKSTLKQRLLDAAPRSKL